MLAVDEMVASFVEELEAVGELDNTYIFFTSDNGFLQGEHRLNNTKDHPYEESARIPLFVRGAGNSSRYRGGGARPEHRLRPDLLRPRGSEVPDRRALAVAAFAR
jgi:hypothetical protein